jgi:hypothetical protein
MLLAFGAAAGFICGLGWPMFERLIGARRN